MGQGRGQVQAKGEGPREEAKSSGLWVQGFSARGSGEVGSCPNPSPRRKKSNIRTMVCTSDTKRRGCLWLGRGGSEGRLEGRQIQPDEAYEAYGGKTPSWERMGSVLGL